MEKPTLDLSRTGRRQNFQPEFFRNLHHARQALRLLRIFADGHQAPPWAGCNRAAQVSSSTDDVAGRSQLADDRVSPARAGSDGIRDEAGGVAAAGQT
jgi:hypothetical protein